MKVTLGITLIALLVPSLAHADPPKGQPAFAYGSKEDAEELAKTEAVAWKAAAQAGLILVTGNSRATTVAAGANASRKSKGNKFALEGGIAYARSSIFLAVDGNSNGTIEPNEVSRPSQTTTRSWNTKARYDRFVTEHNSLYLSAGLMADRPAGKQLVGNGQAGYSREIYKDDVHLIVGEGGYDLAYEDLVAPGDAVVIHSLRGFLGYTGKLSDDTGLDASIEGLTNMNRIDPPGGRVGRWEDNRINGKLAITTKMGENLALQFGFEAHYDHRPAPRPPFAIPFAPGYVPLAEPLDTKTEATLIYNFL